MNEMTVIKFGLPPSFRYIVMTKDHNWSLVNIGFFAAPHHQCKGRFAFEKHLHRFPFRGFGAPAVAHL